jgi:hypothetical protein
MFAYPAGRSGQMDGTAYGWNYDSGGYSKTGGLTFPRWREQIPFKEELTLPLIERTPASMHSRPGRAPDRRYDLAKKAGCASGYLCPVTKVNMVPSWSPCLSASMGHTSMLNGWGYLPVGGRTISASS